MAFRALGIMVGLVAILSFLVPNPVYEIEREMQRLGNHGR